MCSPTIKLSGILVATRGASVMDPNMVMQSRRRNMPAAERGTVGVFSMAEMLADLHTVAAECVGFDSILATGWLLNRRAKLISFQTPKGMFTAVVAINVIVSAAAILNALVNVSDPPATVYVPA